jgi:hypothetical protein
MKGHLILLVPLVTAWITFRSTGARRWLAVVATLASVGYYALMPAPGDARINHPAIGLALFGIGLVAILILAAGRLQYPSQWLAVGAGALAVATFFITFALYMVNDTQLLPLEVSAALLTVGVAVILGVPKIIDAVLKTREERS